MKISDRLKKILKFKKWRQKRLAKELGVSAQRLNQWVNDKSNPDELWIKEKIEALYNECI